MRSSIFVYRTPTSWRTIRLLVLTPKQPLLSWTAVRLCLGLWETVIFVYRTPSWRTILLLTPKPPLLSWTAVRLCLSLWETVIFVYRTPRSWRTILLLLLTPKPPLLSWTAAVRLCLGLAWETVIFVYSRTTSWRTILRHYWHQNHPCCYLERLLDFVSAYEK